ncbi:MAG: antitoxin MazE-like protein [Roseiarcus sp.]
MPRAKRASGDGLSKFQRYRRTRLARGMKLLRVWVPDPRRPEFAREAERQAKLLRGRPEEKEALAFIEAAFSWPEP